MIFELIVLFFFAMWIVAMLLVSGHENDCNGDCNQGRQCNCKGMK